MPRLLFLMLTFLLSGALKRVLLGAGLGLISSTFIIQFFDWYTDRFTLYASADNYGGVFGLLAIAKFPECLSVFMGAIVSRMTINALTLTLGRVSK